MCTENSILVAYVTESPNVSNSIVGALDPRCLSPPKFDDSERGMAPRRIAIAHS